METKVLEKGQVVIPASLRRRLGIKSGDKLKAEVKNGDIVLSPQPRPKYKTRIITSPITGLPVLTSGPNAPVLTTRWSRKCLRISHEIFSRRQHSCRVWPYRTPVLRSRANWAAELARNGIPEFATSSITELGIVRVMSQAYGVSITQAQTLLAGLKESEQYLFDFVVDDHDASKLPNWVSGAKQTTDGHLVELATSKGCVLATLDENIPGSFLIP